jgi:hypothetical protein
MSTATQKQTAAATTTTAAVYATDATVKATNTCYTKSLSGSTIPVTADT